MALKSTLKDNSSTTKSSAKSTTKSTCKAEAKGSKPKLLNNDKMLDKLEELYCTLFKDDDDYCDLPESIAGHDPQI